MKKSIIIWSVLGGLTLIVITGIVLFLCVLYPIKHKEIILKYAEIYKLEPALVCSVINTESGFNKAAVSNAGAKGLMQLMPNTAQEISEKLGVRDYVEEMLYSPEVNIRFGCFYLSYLIEMFGGNINNVVAAYNAGYNKVNEWLNNEEYCENGTIKNPPIEETNNYVKKIHSNLAVYKNRI